MKNISLKKIISISNHEYIRYVTDSRNIIIIAMFVLIYDRIIKGFLELSSKMGESISIFEPVVALCGTSIACAVMPLVYLLTISDFPKIDGNSRFYIIRVGRYNWVFGQLLFSIESALTFILFTFGVTTLLGINNASIQNKWSLVVTQYYVHFPDEWNSAANNLINATLYNQVTPLQATLHTFGLYLLFFIVIALLLMAAFVISAGKTGIYLTTFLVALGTVLAVGESNLMWYFPISNIMVWKHYDEIFNEPVFPISGSYMYFTGIIIVLLIIIFCSIPKKSFDYVE